MLAAQYPFCSVKAYQYTYMPDKICMPWATRVLKPMDRLDQTCPHFSRLVDPCSMISQDGWGILRTT